MPIDPSIALGVKPIQLESPLNQLGQVFQLQGAQQANQLNRLKMDEYDRGVARQNQLRTLLGGLGDVPDEKRVSALRGGGYFDEADKLETGLLARQKTGAEVSERNLKIAKDRYGAYQQELRALYGDPMLTKEKAVARANALSAAGILTPELSASLVASLPDNPAELKDHIAIGLKSQLTPEQLLTAFAPKPTEINSGQQKFFRDTNPNSPTYGQMTGGAAVQLQASPEAVMSDARARSEGAAGRAVTMRGQDLTDRRVRDANEIARDKKAAAGAGNATEGERKAATLLQRMQNSEAQLEAALKKDQSAAKPGLISSGIRSMGMDTIANTVTPENRQKVEAAQLDILDAALTLGTGAAYTKEQLEGYRQSYFPQIGDKPDTIKDKQDRLNNILSAARIAAGRAAGQVTAPIVEVSPQQGPKVGAVQDGYRYKGGDPSKASSWEKM